MSINLTHPDFRRGPPSPLRGEGRMGGGNESEEAELLPVSVSTLFVRSVGELMQRRNFNEK
jgi:hypothetical protein